MRSLVHPHGLTHCTPRPQHGPHHRWIIAHCLRGRQAGWRRNNMPSESRVRVSAHRDSMGKLSHRMGSIKASRGEEHTHLCLTRTHSLSLSLCGPFIRSCLPAISCCRVRRSHEISFTHSVAVNDLSSTPSTSIGIRENSGERKSNQTNKPLTQHKTQKQLSACLRPPLPQPGQSVSQVRKLTHHLFTYC